MPNDYYNVPTDKGTITNLVAIGDSIVVHTKDSMYRFVGSNNLNATNFRAGAKFKCSYREQSLML